MMESVWMISETGLSPEEEKRVDEFEGIMKEKIRQKSKGEAETVKLRQIFKFFDTDQSGHITVDEFKAACERLGLPLERRHARAFFMRYDPDRSGEWPRMTHFCCVMTPMAALPMPLLLLPLFYLVHYGDHRNHFL